MKLWEIIRQKILKNPTQMIKKDNEELSYSEVIQYVEIFAKKIKNEKCCAIYCKSEMLTALILLSCFAAEVTAVPLAVRYGEKYCEKILRKISPSCIITDLCGGLNVYHISDYEYVKPDNAPALIMFTSGTSGEPKGIMLSEKNIVSNIDDISDYIDIDQTDSILISRSLYHVAVLTGEFLLALTKGSKIVFCDDTFNPQKILEQIVQNKITTYCGTPTTMNILAHYSFKCQFNIPLKHIVISGECMSKATGMKIIHAFPKASIYHSYGLTEASPRVCYLPSEYFETAPDCVGIPLKTVNVEIRNSVGEIVPTGTVGTLWVKGPNTMLGYYNDPLGTQSVLIDGWLCTGDMAVVKPNGFIKILGRADDMIIRSGMNIYPAEIESNLKNDPRVTDVLVYGTTDTQMGCNINMEIVGDFCNVNEVKQLCIELLPPHQVPNRIKLFSELPKTGTGKIIRGK